MSRTIIKKNRIGKWFASITAKTVNITNINTESTIIIKKENILYQFHDPVSSFTGRKQTLEDIHDILKKKNVAVICGFGGIGKSELVRAYGKKYSKFYHKNILWINSETYSDIVTSFRGLAVELGIQTQILNSSRFIEQIVTDVYNYLRKQTLLIFDNAVCYKEIKGFLPSTEQYKYIHLLISSQNIEWGNIEKIQLGVLSNIEAHDLIIGQIREFLSQSEIDDDIPELVTALQYMPLALQQAVAYIIDKKKYVSKNYTIRDYINEIDNEDGNIVKLDFEGSPFPEYSNDSYNKTIAITVQMMIDKIKNSGKNLPLIILYIISYLPSDNIDKELFTFMNKTEAYRNENLDESIRLLAKYSAVTVQDNDKTEISIHRMIQRLLRYIIKTYDLHKIILDDALYLTQDFVHIDDVYFSSVLNYVKLYPDVYLNFYEKNEDKIGILNLITRHNFFGIVENIFESEYIDLDDNTIILQAVRTGNLEMVKFLVDKGANIYTKDNDGWGPFHYSLGLAATELAEYFINLGVDINEVVNEGYRPLAIAAAGNIDMVRLLISNGVKVTENFDFSPLISASLGGHLDIIKLLIDEGIPIERYICEVPKSVIPPEILGQILEKSHLDVMTFLLDKKICKMGDIPFADILGKVFIENNFQVIDFCLKNADDSKYVLFRAASVGNEYAVINLLKQKVNVNTQQIENCTPVYIASQEGHLSIVKKLIEYGADIHLPREDNETPLSAAAKNGRMEIVKLLVELGSDVNIQGTHSFTPAGLALVKEHEEVFKYLYRMETIPARHILIPAHTNNVRMAKYLINNGASIDALDEYSYNALMYAAEMNNIEIMKLLLDKGANIDMANVDGETALFRAIRQERVEAVKLLISRGADVNIKRIDMQTPLEIAVANNYKEIVEILVQNNAKIYRDDEFLDAMCFAIFNGHKHLLEYLILNGGQINRLYESNTNLLAYAVMAGNLEIFEFLVKQDPSLLFMELDTKQTLAHIAAEKGHVRMLDILLEKGISLTAKDFQGTSPIGLAASCGKTEAVEALLQLGCDVDTASDFGNALLQNASAEGHLETVHLLLSYNAEVDSADWEGDTALHESSSKGHLSVVKCLVEHGANINLANLNGMTSLHFAAAGGHLEIVEYLLKAGAQVTLRNNIGLLPRSLAEEKGQLDIVECFKRFGF